MSELRPFALIERGDQWVRGSFDGTFLDYEEGIVELAWKTSARGSTNVSATVGAGLAFDNECRLYHSVPDAGIVERVRPRAGVKTRVDETDGISDLFESRAPDTFGDFGSAAPSTVLQTPRGLAVDANDRLYIAESDASRILIYDLWSSRLLRSIVFTKEQPVCLAAHDETVWAVLAPSGRVVKVSTAGGPDAIVLPEGCERVSRVSIAPDGVVALMCNAAGRESAIWIVDINGALLDQFVEPYASDIAWESNAIVVVARQPGADFLRIRIGQPARELVGPLRARGYDGLGIVRTPDRLTESHSCDCGGHCGCAGASYRIGYWSDRGFRTAIPARLEYERTGRVMTYRLDSGEYQTQWGRVFLDACIPPGTSVRIAAVSSDESDDDVTVPRMLPANVERISIHRPDLSPPMPPVALVPSPFEIDGRITERASGRELPWTQPSVSDAFRTYEGWLDAPPGRYLWVALELSGNTKSTPRIRALRAEHPAHDYLRRLPKLFSREEQSASFLRRYLAMFEGFIGETEARSVDRNVLLAPRTAPEEVLPWLASFLGLVLDERWARAPRPGGKTTDARRAIIELAAWLFRYRGTVGGLRKFIELYAGVDVVLLEHFRFRARMSAMLGGSAADAASSMLGVGFRVGDSPQAATDGSTAPNDSHAHRFTVLIPTVLNAEELDVVRQILTVHRPAHTIFDVCTVGAGMRAGHGLHVGISSMVGPTGGFSQLQLGSTPLGRGGILGRPSNGITTEASKVGQSSRVRP